MADNPVPAATVREVDGQLVLDDPQALAMIKVVAKHNCRCLFDLNAARVAHFKSRIQALGHSHATAVVVVINVDDPIGAVLSDILMPGADWSQYRARGELPIARGIAVRPEIDAFIRECDRDAHAKLVAAKSVATVVVDHGVIEVFE